MADAISPPPFTRHLVIRRLCSDQSPDLGQRTAGENPAYVGMMAARPRIFRGVTIAVVILLLLVVVVAIDAGWDGENH